MLFWLNGLFEISSTEKEGWALLGRDGGRGMASWATPCEEDECDIVRTLVDSGYIGDGTSSEL
jgi:hypothetical protein